MPQPPTTLADYLNTPTYYDPYLGAVVPVGDATISGLPQDTPAGPGLFSSIGNTLSALADAALTIPKALVAQVGNSAGNVSSGIGTGLKWALIIGAVYLVYRDARRAAPVRRSTARRRSKLSTQPRP